MMRSDAILTSACVLGLFLLPGGSAMAETGALTQLPGADACVSENGSGGACADGVAFDFPARRGGQPAMRWRRSRATANEPSPAEAP